jgi:hypothetical protein
MDVSFWDKTEEIVKKITACAQILSDIIVSKEV